MRAKTFQKIREIVKENQELKASIIDMGIKHKKEIDMYLREITSQNKTIDLLRTEIRKRKVYDEKFNQCPFTKK